MSGYVYLIHCKPAIKRLPRYDDEPDLREDLAAALDEIQLVMER